MANDHHESVRVDAQRYHSLSKDYNQFLEDLLAGAEFDEETNTVTIEYELLDFAHRVSSLKGSNGEPEEAEKYWQMWVRNYERHELDDSTL